MATEKSNLKPAECIAKRKLLPVVGHTVAKFNRLLLFWGGYFEDSKRHQNFSDPDRILVYDTEIDKWFSFTTDGEFPPQNSGCCSVLCGCSWYICGGFFDQNVDAPTELYELNLRTLKWTRVRASNKKCPTPRNKFVGWEYKNKLYFFGGFGTLPSILSYDETHDYITTHGSFDQDNGSCYCWNNQLLSFDLEKRVWHSVATKGPVPSSRAAHSAVKINDRTVLIFGGRHMQNRMNDMYLLNLETMTWIKLPTTPRWPVGRSWHCMDALDSQRLVVFGGFNQECVPLKDLWILNTCTFEWSELTWENADLQPKLWHTGAVVDHVLYVFGGCKTNIFAHEENPIFSNELVPIKFQPTSLLQSCALVLLTRNDKGSKTKDLMLLMPNVLQKRLRAMLHCDTSSIRTPFDLLRVY